MTTLTRAALALASLFVLGALAVTFLPAEPDGVECGTWVSPDWDEERVDSLLGRAEDIYDSGMMQGDALAIASATRANYAACEDALNVRRNVTLGLLGAALVVPGALVFTGRGSRRG